MLALECSWHRQVPFPELEDAVLLVFMFESARLYYEKLPAGRTKEQLDNTVVNVFASHFCEGFRRVIKRACIPRNFDLSET